MHVSRASYYIADPPSKSQPVFARLRKDAQYPQVSRTTHRQGQWVYIGSWSGALLLNISMHHMVWMLQQQSQIYIRPWQCLQTMRRQTNTHRTASLADGGQHSITCAMSVHPIFDNDGLPTHAAAWRARWQSPGMAGCTA